MNSGSQPGCSTYTASFMTAVVGVVHGLSLLLSLLLLPNTGGGGFLFLWAAFGGDGRDVDDAAGAVDAPGGPPPTTPDCSISLAIAFTPLTCNTGFSTTSGCKMRKKNIKVKICTCTAAVHVYNYYLHVPGIYVHRLHSLVVTQHFCRHNARIKFCN